MSKLEDPASLIEWAYQNYLTECYIHNECDCVALDFNTWVTVAVKA